MKLGVELTFLPRAKPDGFAVGEGRTTVARFNRRLKEAGDTGFKAKEEMHGAIHDLIEVPSEPLASSVYLVSPDLERRLNRVFAIAKGLGLSGRISPTHRGVTKVFPDGGSHIHSSIDMFADNERPDFLPRLDRFQRNLYHDFANRPYIRWLFAHPFDDLNSRVLCHPGKIVRNPIRLGYKVWAILPRFTGMRKDHLPTFEHRYFGATQDAHETLCNLVFVNNWMTSLRKTVESGKRLKVTLTSSYFRSLKQPRFAWREVSDFLTLIGCTPPSTYRETFERNYLTRMKWGTMT